MLGTSKAFSEAIYETVVEDPAKGVAPRGVIVEFDDEIEGFVPIGQLAIEGLEKPIEYFRAEDPEMPLTVIKIQPESRKVVLSASKYFESHQDELEAYVAAHPHRELTEEELAELEREHDDDLDREMAEEDS